jgi:hypothetical protein
MPCTVTLASRPNKLSQFEVRVHKEQQSGKQQDKLLHSIRAITAFLPCTRQMCLILENLVHAKI